MLTPEQQATLKAFIQGDTALNAMYVEGNLSGLADALNATASPSYTVWRTNVPAGEIGNAWNGADIDGMSALNMQRLQLLLASAPDGVFDMSRVDRRTGFLNPFGTNQNNPSRVAMNIVFRRFASVLEKLFASGTGSDASPAVMTVQGAISYTELVGL